MPNGRTQQLRGIAESLAPSRAAPQQQMNEASRVMGLQQAMASQPQMTPTQTRQLAAGQVQQQTQGQLQPVQQGLQQAAQLTQKAGQIQQQGVEQLMAEKRWELAKKQRTLSKALENTDKALKAELVDKQMQFSRDEMGRTFWNERQLADWKLATAKSDEEFRNFQQQMAQESERRMTMLRTAHAQIEQAMKQSFQSKEQALNQEQQMRLAQAKAALEEKMRKEAARQRNRGLMGQAAGMIVGAAVVAAVVGTGGGAAVLVPAMAGGASAGGGLGSVVAGTTN